jgi:hypothetical protein
MRFAISSADLGVSFTNWPGSLPVSIQPFLSSASTGWTVEGEPGACDVRIDSAARRIGVPINDLSRGLIAGLCMAAAERPDALAVHAAACAIESRCVLMVAPPGGGKSTLATLLDTTRLLSDELILLRRVDGSTVAHGTPVRSACPRPPSVESAAVVSVLFLRKSREDRLEPISESAAVEEMLGQVWAAPTLGVSVLLRRARQALTGIPTYRFHFRNAPSCVRHVLPLLAEAA